MALPMSVSLTASLDILLNVFLAIAVDNLADADALGDGEGEGDEEVRMTHFYRFKWAVYFFIALNELFNFLSL